jgi:hypothetical protein
MGKVMAVLKPLLAGRTDLSAVSGRSRHGWPVVSLGRRITDVAMDRQGLINCHGVIPQAFIQELLARTDIVDVVGQHVKLRKAGANLLGLCPFHGEKSPSFTVSPAKQFYHCFGCGAHGSALGFLMEHTGVSYVEAIGDLARAAGLTVPQESGRDSGRLRGSRPICSS